jgi:hypothetical protein
MPPQTYPRLGKIFPSSSPFPTTGEDFYPNLNPTGPRLRKIFNPYPRSLPRGRIFTQTWTRRGTETRRGPPPQDNQCPVGNFNPYPIPNPVGNLIRVRSYREFGLFLQTHNRYPWRNEDDRDYLISESLGIRFSPIHPRRGGVQESLSGTTAALSPSGWEPPNPPPLSFL